MGSLTMSEKSYRLKSNRYKLGKASINGCDFEKASDVAIGEFAIDLSIEEWRLPLSKAIRLLCLDEDELHQQKHY